MTERFGGGGGLALVLLALVGAGFLVGTLEGDARLVYYAGYSDGDESDALYVEWWDGPSLFVEEHWAEVRYRAGRYEYRAESGWRPLDEHPKAGWMMEIERGE